MRCSRGGGSDNKVVRDAQGMGVTIQHGSTNLFEQNQTLVAPGDSQTTGVVVEFHAPSPRRTHPRLQSRRAHGLRQLPLGKRGKRRAFRLDRGSERRPRGSECTRTPCVHLFQPSAVRASSAPAHRSNTTARRHIMPRKPFVPPPPREKRSRASKDAAPSYLSDGMPTDEPPKKKGRAWGNAAKNCTSAFRGVTGKPGAIRRPLDRKRSARREGNFYRRTQASGRPTSRCRTRRRSTSAPSRRKSTRRARSTRNAAPSATASLQSECCARFAPFSCPVADRAAFRVEGARGVDLGLEGAEVLRLLVRHLDVGLPLA